MTLIFCLDDNNGLTFGGKRQSRDARVIERMIGFLHGTDRLAVSAYSASLFPESVSKRLCLIRSVDEGAQAEFCFLEDLPFPVLTEQIERLVIFRWNRRYPFDERLSLDLSAYHLVGSEDFSGKSHEKITMEIYERKIGHEV